MNQSYVCDTLPAPRLATDHSVSLHPSNVPNDPVHTLRLSPSPDSDSTPRKLCVRHQRMADEGTNLKLQQVRFISQHTLYSHLMLLSPWMLCPSKSEKQSMQSGPTSHRPPIVAGLPFSKVSSQCAASLSCPSSQSNSLISFALIPSSFYPGKSLLRFLVTLTPHPFAVQPKLPGSGEVWPMTTTSGEASANSTLDRNAANAAGAYLF
jgi:hypothetical protein